MLVLVWLPRQTRSLSPLNLLLQVLPLLAAVELQGLVPRYQTRAFQPENRHDRQSNFVHRNKTECQHSMNLEQISDLLLLN